ncbi:MAG: precorrin-6y C5,15-methyltransferase (decarboxylating) subunit CbiE [Muribaculaceae bacterium]|nr:precorrin-6y C5,15-methyltransferase (decarboxylating) subunit CbiE [Muribaculaceae bacterium]
MKFYVIGISDAPRPFFLPEVIKIICQGRIFSGGKRHYRLVAPYLPEGSTWIDIITPLDAVFEQYHDHDEVIVFASGDPLFFGFANTIKRKMPDAEIVLFPSFNSLQLLAHRLVMPYHDMRIVSLTGRPWPEFDRALIERAEKIGVLTDHEHTPAAIAHRMIEYGYNDYTMHVGEHLGNPDEERVTTCRLEEATKLEFDYPNCLILCGQTKPRLYGIPEREFALLDGREKMITKASIRLLTLQALELPQKHVLWDIGFCTGSVSIEARLQFPHLHIEAFEIRPECEALIQENSRRFGAPGINYHIGDFLEADIDALPRPDAVFIGGHSGQLKEIMARVLSVLADDGCIVMNSVTSPMVHIDSHQLFNEACAELGLTQEPPTRIILNDNNPIEILKCKKKF